MATGFPNPVVAFSITQQRRRVALKLTLSQAPAGPILVLASCPYNQGRDYCDKFLYIGPLPPPVRGQSEITAQYLKKHARPWPGSRVILRICQQLNGWRSLPERIEAVLPPTQPPPTQPKRRRTSPAAR